jgi:hypothetical protein
MRINKNDKHQGCTGRCSVCGEESSAYWAGVTLIEVCSPCAVDVLPQLTADAIHCTTDVATESTAQRMLTRFWRALSLRLIREQRQGCRA